MALIVTFSGEYDVACKSELRTDLTASALDEPLVLDFSRVSFIDSTCVTELVIASGLRARAGLPPAAIVAPEGSVKRVLGMLQVNRLFRVVGSLDEAVGGSGQRFAVRAARAGSRVGELAPA